MGLRAGRKIGSQNISYFIVFIVFFKNHSAPATVRQAAKRGRKRIRANFSTDLSTASSTVVPKACYGLARPHSLCPIEGDNGLQ